MNELLFLRPGHWNLIILPRQRVDQLLVAMAHLALQTPLTVFDCGRQFDSSVVARAAHGRQEIIDRIRVQRAFICYEVVKLLERAPMGRVPILVLDFLSTFHDENVKMHTRRFLLEGSIQCFQTLSRSMGLAVTIQTSSTHDELYQRLSSSAPRVSVYETQESGTQQLSLF